MANKFSDRGNFNIPSALIDEHEWMVDELIDSVDISQPCKLIYAPIHSVCPNCYQDPTTGRSSGIYKTSPPGPVPFSNYTKCPHCGGEGKSVLPQTELINCRVYWRPEDWLKVGVSIDNPEATAQVIGYMKDFAKFERARYIVLVNDQSGMAEWKCQRKGKGVPHGFRQDRYFINFVELAGGA